MRDRRDSGVLAPVMSTIDEDDHERECKHALSIVPSSYSNLPSSLEGFGADAQNHYHHQPPPLSAASDTSAGMFSDLFSEAGASTGPGVEEWSPEELQKEDPLSIQMWRLYARTKANLPHAQRMEWRMVGMALGRQRLEEQMQAHQHPQQQYPRGQTIHMEMKEQEQEEHKLVPVDEQVDAPDRGCRLQKYGGSAAIPGSMITSSAPTIMRVKA